MTAVDVSFSSAIISCEKGGHWAHTLALLDELSFNSVREREGTTVGAIIGAMREPGMPAQHEVVN